MCLLARACSENILIRVTPEERKLVLEEAAKLGLTVSGFLIWKAVGEKLGDAILDARKRGRKKPL